MGAAKRARGGGGGNAGHDHVPGDIAGHDGPGRDDGAGADRHLRLDDRAVADPGVRAEGGAAGGTGGEEGGVIGRVVPMAGGAIEEIVQRGVVHRVVSGADPGHRGDVGEFADGGIGNVGKPVAAGAGLEGGVGDAGAFADLGPGCEG